MPVACATAATIAMDAPSWLQNVPTTISRYTPEACVSNAIPRNSIRGSSRGKQWPSLSKYPKNCTENEAFARYFIIYNFPAYLTNHKYITFFGQFSKLTVA
jgi:hypothetical protein